MSQTFQYHIAATGLDVDRIANSLSQYGITNIQIQRGPNANGISVSLDNPTQEQMMVIQQILMPLEQEYKSIVYKSLLPFVMPRTEMPLLPLPTSNSPEAYSPQNTYEQYPVSSHRPAAQSQINLLPLPTYSSPEAYSPPYPVLSSLSPTRSQINLLPLPALGQFTGPNNVEFELP